MRRQARTLATARVTVAAAKVAAKVDREARALTEPRPTYDFDVTFDLPDFDAIAREYSAIKPPGSIEYCRCGARAHHKVVEGIDNESVHALSVYLCHDCFVKLMGPAADIPFLSKSGN